MKASLSLDKSTVALVEFDTGMTWSDLIKKDPIRFNVWTDKVTVAYIHGRDRMPILYPCEKIGYGSYVHIDELVSNINYKLVPAGGAN